MDDADKKEILDSIATIADAVASLTEEVRTGFEKLDTRLARVEEELAALSKSVDGLLEGDTLGTEHITLTRAEYDKFTELAHLPNRFAQT
jgi:phage-related tail protein